MRYFNGRNKTQLKAEIDNISLPGFAEELEAAAAQGDYKTALIQAIAEKWEATTNPAKLTVVLAHFHKALGFLYPRTLHPEDPYLKEVQNV